MPSSQLLHQNNNWSFIQIAKKKETFNAIIAQLVKRVNGFEKYKKWAKLDPCFSFNKPTKQDILYFLKCLGAKFCTQKNHHIFENKFVQN